MTNIYCIYIEGEMDSGVHTVQYMRIYSNKDTCESMGFKHKTTKTG